MWVGATSSKISAPCEHCTLIYNKLNNFPTTTVQNFSLCKKINFFGPIHQAGISALHITDDDLRPLILPPNAPGHAHGLNWNRAAAFAVVGKALATRNHAMSQR